MFKQYYDVVTLWRSSRIDLVSYASDSTKNLQSFSGASAYLNSSEPLTQSIELKVFNIHTHYIYYNLSCTVTDMNGRLCGL